MVELYQKLVVAYSKATFQAKKPDSFYRQKLGWNRLCGDEVNFYLSGENSHPEVWYDCKGCALCKASCAILVETQNLKPKTDVIQILESFVTTKPVIFPEPINTLLTARSFPARLKCVVLPWQTLLACLTEDAPENLYVTTE